MTEQKMTLLELSYKQRFDFFLLFKTDNSSVYVILTLRKGIGKHTSTLWTIWPSDDFIFVTSSNLVLNISTPFSVERSHLSVKSFVSSISSILVIILILPELRSLQIVQVDSVLGVSKILLSTKLLINEDFPDPVSPEIWKKRF